MNLRLVIENFMKVKPSSRLLLIYLDGFAVWGINLHTMSWLPPSRPHPRCDSLYSSPPSSFSSLRDRVAGCRPRERGHCPFQTEWVWTSRLSRRRAPWLSWSPSEQRVPINLAKYRLGSWCERISLFARHNCDSLQVYPPSVDRDHLRGSRNHRLAQKLLLRLHQSGSPTRSPEPEICGYSAGDIFSMPISEKRYPGQPIVFLVGSDSRISASIPSLDTHPLGICGQKIRRGRRT